MIIEEKIKELGYELPEPVKPLASYIPALVDGKMVYTSGQVPAVKGEIKYTGKAGKDLSLEDAQKASEICFLNCLAAVKLVAGDLDNIERIIKLTVFVNSAEDFGDQPKVANGASDLAIKIFGEAGKHTRSAVGAAGLPVNSAVEIEMIAKLK